MIRAPMLRLFLALALLAGVAGTAAAQGPLRVGSVVERTLAIDGKRVALRDHPDHSKELTLA